MNHKDRSEYARLEQDSASEASEPFLPDSENGEPLIKSNQRNVLKWCIQASILIISMLLAALAGGTWVHHRWVANTDGFCASKTAKYSPVIDHVDIRYHLQSFNGSLLKENIYRKGPSPEVDAAWEALGVNYRSIVVPESLAEKSGIVPGQVKVNAHYGGGYPAQIEGFHQLHCLNLLRQSSYYNFKYYYALKQGPFKNDDMILKLHITHCLDIIRQQLMCTLDTAVFGQVWVDKVHPFAYVDFNAKDHVCKNFEDVRQWAENHQIPEEVPNDFLEAPENLDMVYAKVP